MNEKTLSIIFKEDVPLDLLSPCLSVNYYDLFAGKSLDKTITYPTVYNAVEKGEVISPREKALRYFIERLHEENFTLYKPAAGNIEEDILVEKDGVLHLFVFVLDSESERKLWPLDKLGEGYRIYIIRDRVSEERKGFIPLTLDEAFDSFNFFNR